MASDLTNAAAVREHLLSFENDSIIEPRNGYVIFLATERSMTAHDITNSILEAAGASNVNSKALKTSICRLLKEFAKRKRNGLSVERNRVLLRAFLNSAFQIPHVTQICKPQSADQEAPFLPDSPVPGALRNECENCVTRRGEAVVLMKTVKEKVRATKKDLREVKKRFNVKYVNQFKKRKAEQLSTRDRVLEKLKGSVETLKRQNVTSFSTQIKLLQEENRALKRQVTDLQRQNAKLEKQVQVMKVLQHEITDLEKAMEVTADQAGDSSGHSEIECKIDGKLYDMPVRKSVYKCLLANVPVESIGQVLSYALSALAGKRLKNIPSPSTCAQMMRELGVLSDIQSAEAILQASSCCLAWDATTLDGKHINEVHINTPSDVFTLNTRQLPGGKATDYVQHILDTLGDLSSLHADFSNTDPSTVLSRMKGKILSTLTDRAAANHATVTLLNEDLGRSLLELNCQMHPLDGLANAARSTLKVLDQERGERSRSFGSDCQVANVLQLISKLRYKEKGDPAGFKAHLRANGLTCGTFVRYVGNRLHVLFHLAGKVHQHKRLLIEFAEGICCNGQMSLALRTDLRQPSISLHLQALGLLGKVVTGPWMALFYTSVTERRHFELSEYLRCAIHRLEVLEDQADLVVSCETDVFGRPLVEDETLQSLRVCEDITELSVVLSKLINASLIVLKRQLVRYMYGDLSNPSQDLLDKACAAPVHNIWAERNLGMFDAQARRAANACTQFLDAKVKAAFNKTLVWLGSFDTEHQNKLITFAAHTAIKSRIREEQRQSDINKEIFARLKVKLQLKDMSKRRKLERDIRMAISSKQGVDSEAFSCLDSNTRDVLHGIMAAPDSLVGKAISHIWYEDGNDIVYFGRVLKLARKSCDITITYWKEGEAEEDGEDFKLKFENVLTDVALGDLVVTP